MGRLLTAPLGAAALAGVGLAVGTILAAGAIEELADRARTLGGGS